MIRHNDRLHVTTRGTAFEVAEADKQLAWLAATLQHSPSGSMVYCTPIITQYWHTDLRETEIRSDISDIKAFCQIEFEFEVIQSDSSWQKMIPNEIIARRFPIARQLNPSSSLDVTFKVLRELHAGTTKRIVLEDWLFIIVIGGFLGIVQRLGYTLCWMFFSVPDDGIGLYLHCLSMDGTWPAMSTTNPATLGDFQHIVSGCSTLSTRGDASPQWCLFDDMKTSKPATSLECLKQFRTVSLSTDISLLFTVDKDESVLLADSEFFVMTISSDKLIDSDMLLISEFTDQIHLFGMKPALLQILNRIFYQLLEEWQTTRKCQNFFQQNMSI